MANCTNWQELTIQQKIWMVGSITHIMQNSEVGFNAIENIIMAADEAGLFKDVVINPEIQR